MRGVDDNYNYGNVEKPVDKGQLLRMKRVLTHRGPDDECMLARRRRTPVLPTPGQKEAQWRADLAASWLLRSISACRGNGSAAFYSRWYLPLKGWSHPYPETTGYIIPTLLKYATFASRPNFAHVAVQLADWIQSLQFDDGSLPGGVLVNGREGGPSVFNTGQMILGLVAVADYTGESRYLDTAVRAARWLASTIDRTEGIWQHNAYISGYSPAYYSRVCWPMLEVYSRSHEETIKLDAIRALDTIASWQMDNGSFQNWEFVPGQPAFTHTIAYTIRGLLEAGHILEDEGYRFTDAAMKSADVFRRKMELRGRLAGAYDRRLAGRFWYTCLTGNCQMALIWMNIYAWQQDARFLSAGLKALQCVMKCQRVRSVDPNVRGAVAGSTPFCGRYLTLRYPNWATNFFLDALMAAHTHITCLLESGPCKSS